MKKILSLSLVLLMGIACMQAAHPEKLIHGKFQVAPNEYAKFASANLCCHGNGHTFGFLSAQYEARKSNNEAITSTWTGTWDLFGWGTSGYNSVQPWLTSTNNSDYAYDVPENTDLGTSSYDEYDWGIHNKIDGINAANYYCPTAAEWDYVLNKRPNAENLRALATITIGGSPKGLILLPDNWSTPLDLVINTKATDYTTNKYSNTAWTILEKCGAVFLPFVGVRTGTTWTDEESVYWTGTSGSISNVAMAAFISAAPEVKTSTRSHGHAVRLMENWVYSCTTVKGEETKEDKTIEEYEWNGRTLTKSGNYTYTFLDVRAETDSIATLHLHMKDWTGIDNVPTTKQTKVQKVVRDGQLYIIRDDKMFNVAGQEVK